MRDDNPFPQELRLPRHIFEVWFYYLCAYNGAVLPDSLQGLLDPLRSLMRANSPGDVVILIHAGVSFTRSQIGTWDDRAGIREALWELIQRTRTAESPEVRAAWDCLMLAEPE